jgi:hypothetical protein
MFIYHTLGMILKLPFNLAKVLTELIPGMGEEACRIAKKNAKAGSFKYHAANVGYLILSTIHFVGRAATSPVKGWLSAIHNHSKGLGIISFILSAVIWGAIIALSLGVAAVPVIGGGVSLATKLFNDTFLFSLSMYPIIIGTALYNDCYRNNNGVLKPLLRSIQRCFKNKTNAPRNDNEMTTKLALGTFKEGSSADFTPLKTTNNNSVIERDIATTPPIKRTLPKQNIPVEQPRAEEIKRVFHSI